MNRGWPFSVWVVGKYPCSGMNRISDQGGTAAIIGRPTAVRQIGSRTSRTLLPLGGTTLEIARGSGTQGGVWLALFVIASAPASADAAGPRNLASPNGRIRVALDMPGGG